MSSEIEFMPPSDVVHDLEGLGISRKEIDRLGRYLSVLERWRHRINLIGPASHSDIWRRHILDSAQAWPVLRSKQSSDAVIDLGSGAGFPGIVLACLGATPMTLVDSDQRKAVFLREAARHVEVNVRVIPERFDKALRQDMVGAFQVVTGRAVAPLARLAPFIYRALSADGIALLHKGAQVEKELTEAMKNWTMNYELIPSITSEDGVLIKIWCLKPNDANELTNNG